MRDRAPEDRIQLLVSSLLQDTATLPARMGLMHGDMPVCDILIFNQCDSMSQEKTVYPTGSVSVMNSPSRGVGLSRNTLLMHADAPLIMFADDDIVYDPGFQDRIAEEFSAHPEADILLFNVEAAEGRRTYHNNSFGRVHLWNSGRYPAYAIGARRDSLIRSRVQFSLLFGGGAKYSNGEDSLFLKDCLEARLSIYKTPVCLGHEVQRPDDGNVSGSTWFEGYTDRFYHDRGVLYHFLYGSLALPMSLRFLLAHRDVRGGRRISDCLKLMQSGIKEACK